MRQEQQFLGGQLHADMQPHTDAGEALPKGLNHAETQAGLP